jgi:hypothetical protein
LAAAYYAIGVLAMLLNKRSKRLGDFAAGTIVVREGRASVSAMPAHVAEGGGYSLSSADASLVRDFDAAWLDGSRAPRRTAERLALVLGTLRPAVGDARCRVVPRAPDV